MTSTKSDIVIVGAGAAGLMAAIWAGRTDSRRSIILLDGARKLGAKILVAGGGRCNVTHYHVDPKRYAGSTTPAIARVLRRFDVAETTRFFKEMGISLKRESTGKLFPTSDKARDVLNALLTAANDANVDIRNPCRVDNVSRTPDGYAVDGEWGHLTCEKLVLATGGYSLPKSGSDGKGFEFVSALGHSPTRTFPALVPLTLPGDDQICQLSGITLPACIRLHSATGKRIAAFTDSTLCTHFGLSGPAILDISRYYLDAVSKDPASYLTINWLPAMSTDNVDDGLQALGRRSVQAYLRKCGLPERLSAMLCRCAGIPEGTRGDQLLRRQRLDLSTAATAMRLAITGDRGYTFAEVTAGGIPLNEITLKSMESRCCPGLYLCGELCDVDGPIGGFNFQWAWASGYVAGVSI